MNIIKFPNAVQRTNAQKNKEYGKPAKEQADESSDRPRFLTRQGKLVAQNSLFRLAQLSQIMRLIDQLDTYSDTMVSSNVIRLIKE